MRRFLDSYQSAVFEGFLLRAFELASQRLKYFQTEPPNVGINVKAKVTFPLVRHQQQADQLFSTSDLQW